MKLFFWQKDQSVKAFAHALANDLTSRLDAETLSEYLATVNTPEAKSGKAAAASTKKTARHSQDIQRRLTEVILQVRQFKSDQRLGVYGKARLHQAFEGRLTELGYPPALAHEVNRLILLQTP